MFNKQGYLITSVLFSTDAKKKRGQKGSLQLLVLSHKQKTLKVCCNIGKNPIEHASPLNCMHKNIASTPNLKL